MVNQCANPVCHKELHYLREGRVFLFSRRNSSFDNHKLPHRLEHFWLCGDCSKAFKLEMDDTNGMKLVETKHRRPRRSYTNASLAPAS